MGCVILGKIPPIGQILNMMNKMNFSLEDLDKDYYSELNKLALYKCHKKKGVTCRFGAP